MYNDAETDSALIVVHEDEMSAEVAAALNEQGNIIAKYLVRRPHEEVDGSPSYAVTSVLVPREEIPGRKAAHIEYVDGVIAVMYDEKQITGTLAHAIDALATEISKLYYTR